MPIVPDIAVLQEPNLLIPGEKPIGPTRVDWEHPIAPSLRNVFTFNGTDLITGEPLTLNGNVSIEANYVLHGPGAYGDEAVAVNNLPLGSSSRYMGLILKIGEFNVSTHSIIVSNGHNDPYIGGGKITLYAEDNAISVGFDGHRRISPKGALSIGDKLHIVVQNKSTTSDSTDLYINGVKQSLSTESGSSQTLNIFDRLSFFNAQAELNYGKHDIEFFYAGEGLLSEEMIVDLNRDPYQFLIPA